MKKILLPLFLLTTLHTHNSFGLAATTYEPVQGPLQLADIKTTAGVITQTGAITQALGKSDLQQEATAIAAFAATVPIAATYQDIITAINNSPNNQLALNALRAFEKVIMYLYQKEAYIIHMKYRPCTSTILPNGLRWSWTHPTSWLNVKSWASDNNKKLEQLVDELEKLSHVAYGHDKALSLRMKTTVQAYRNWRTVIGAALISYLSWNTYQNGSSSVLAAFVQQAGQDVADAASTIGNKVTEIGNKGLELGTQAAQDAWNITSSTISSAASNALQKISYFK